jgi:hypothetical protein
MIQTKLFALASILSCAFVGAYAQTEVAFIGGNIIICGKAQAFLEAAPAMTGSDTAQRGTRQARPTKRTRS